MAYALKIQSKLELLDQRQASSAKRERAVMAKLDHPFVCRLVNTFQDDACILYMLLSLIKGGELLNLIQGEEMHALFTGILSRRMCCWTRMVIWSLSTSDFVSVMPCLLSFSPISAAFQNVLSCTREPLHLTCCSQSSDRQDLHILRDTTLPF